ncbi:rhomboid-like protein [Kitasatospora mediocidica]|uniref:rhomboid-like protein n=1 Tax=Kitasatospora mediocidica TaxID=58352 RepID=UPI0012F91016|nr:rhomboid-like protein [Kitasatospora mediocidica]
MTGASTRTVASESMKDRSAVRTDNRPDPGGPAPERGPVLRVLRLVATRLPLTTGYVLVLTLVACWLAGESHSERARFIRHNSSNVHHMEVGKWWTLFTSGLVVDGVPAWLGILAVAAVVGLAEWRWGAARAGAVFAFGHLGATLLTEGSMWVMLATGIPGALSHARDVGISYGLVATAGCLLALGPERARRYGLPALALVLAATWAFDQGLADAGHLIALGLGVLASRSTLFRTPEPTRAG